METQTMVVETETMVILETEIQMETPIPTMMVQMGTLEMGITTPTMVTETIKMA